MRRHILIAAKDHGYCDGASYQRQDPYRNSPFDTAILVLQTAKASRKWPAHDKFEAALRSAFAECVPSAAAVARQLKHDAGAKPKGEKGEKRKRPSEGGGGNSGHGQTFDAATEAKLNAWVQAKRKGDFAKSDMIRSELAAEGIDAAAARPPRQKVAADNKRAKTQEQEEA